MSAKDRFKNRSVDEKLIDWIELAIMVLVAIQFGLEYVPITALVIWLQNRTASR